MIAREERAIIAIVDRHDPHRSFRVRDRDRLAALRTAAAALFVAARLPERPVPRLSEAAMRDTGGTSTGTATASAVNKRRFPFALVAAFALSSCNSSTSEGEYQVVGSSGLFAKAQFDEDAAREDAVADVGSETFSVVGDTSTCTDDCSGHEAGFEYAKEQGYTDSSECSGGSSQSFNEGCEAFGAAIEERVEEARSEFEGGGE